MSCGTTHVFCRPPRSASSDNRGWADICVTGASGLPEERRELMRVAFKVHERREASVVGQGPSCVPAATPT